MWSLANLSRLPTYLEFSNTTLQKKKQPQTLIFELPCLTVLMTNLRLYSLFFGLLKYFLVLKLPKKKKTTLDSSTLRILRHFDLGQSTWSLANLSRLRICLKFSNGTFLGLLPHKLSLIRRQRIVEMCTSSPVLSLWM